MMFATFSSRRRPCALACGTLLSLLAAGACHAADAPAYKVGERLAQAPAATPGKYQEITWSALAPPNWDPMAEFKKLDLGRLRDGDPRSNAILDKMRQAWDQAPVVPAMEGRAVRIPGFIIPLDQDHNLLREFLLVPYFGACIHVPPPPSNQIIHVLASPPLKDVQMMDAVWVEGRLHIDRSDSPFGATAYRMDADTARAYKAPDKK